MPPQPPERPAGAIASPADAEVVRRERRNAGMPMAHAEADSQCITLSKVAATMKTT
jgi:hypothetical protein